MKRAAVLMVLILAVLCAGCATVDTDHGKLKREDVIKLIDRGEVAFCLALNYAQLLNVDQVQLNKILITGTIAFDLAKDIVAIDLRETDKTSLKLQLVQLRVVMEDALALCAAAGVNAGKIQAIRVNADAVFIVLESVINALPDKA